MVKKRFTIGIITLVMMSLIVLSGSAGATVPAGCPTGITNYWQLNEPSGTSFVDVVGGDDASCDDTSSDTICPAPVSGQVNGAQSFSDSQGIDAPGNASFDWGKDQSFSIALWVNTTASSCSGVQVFVGRNDASTQLQWWVGCGLNVNNINAANFVLQDTDGGSDITILEGSKNLVSNPGWHHIVVVRDGSTGNMTLYVDGTSEDSKPGRTYSSGFDAADDVNLNIGWLNLTSKFHFAGAIDEVALYNVALTPGEITSLYNSGSAYCAPIISVSPPSTDFGSVVVGNTSAPTPFEIRNNGIPGTSLLVGSVTLTGTNFDQFLIQSNTCTQPLTPNDTCTVNVEFKPTSVGSKSANVSILSNDPQTPTTEAGITGTGTVPGISVSGISPFADTTVGASSAPQIVTIGNTGTAVLQVFNIQITGPNTSDFTLDLNGGSSPCAIATPTIALNASCTVAVTFSPQSAGAKSASLEITSSDPNSGTLDVALSGTGLSADNPPTQPSLVSPTNGQTGLDTTVTFVWQKSTDPDQGDTVSYKLYYCEDQNFGAGCNPPIDVASAAKKTIFYAGTFGSGAGLVFFGIALAGGATRRRKIMAILAMVIITGLVLVSCGGGGGGGSTPARTNLVSQSVSGLNAASTYFWKVVADDGKGGTTESTTWSFSTK